MSITPLRMCSEWVRTGKIRVSSVLRIGWILREEVTRKIGYTGGVMTPKFEDWTGSESKWVISEIGLFSAHLWRRA